MTDRPFLLTTLSPRAQQVAAAMAQASIEEQLQTPMPFANLSTAPEAPTDGP